MPAAAAAPASAFGRLFCRETGPVLSVVLLLEVTFWVLRTTDRYGFEIYKTIRDATDGEYEIKEATLYATFRRLVKDGLVEAYWGDETQGGRRKYYRITDAGRAVYRQSVLDWVATQKIINTLLDLPTATKATER